MFRMYSVKKGNEGLSKEHKCSKQDTATEVGLCTITLHHGDPGEDNVRG